MCKNLGWKKGYLVGHSRESNSSFLFGHLDWKNMKRIEKGWTSLSMVVVVVANGVVEGSGTRGGGGDHWKRRRMDGGDRRHESINKRICWGGRPK